jgi:hypothetical protein
VVLLPVSASAGPQHSECVGARSGCLPTLRAALAEATDGETILLGTGRYRGGVTIAKSVHLMGAGERRTAIVGGGPVVTVTRRADGSNPTVTLSDLALTGGSASGTASPDRARGFGGGLYVPTPDGKISATVTLTRVWVHDNRATATRTLHSPGDPVCPDGICPFALGAGGGIFNSGRMTVIDSRIDRNVVDGPLSDADGGGIYSQIGSLTLASSTVADNQARPQGGIGRHAQGGGVFVDDGSFRVSDTTILHNSADLVTSWPIHGQGGVVIDMNANSGGIHIGDDAQVRITRSRLVGNSIKAVDPRGEPAAFDSALVAGNSTVAIDRTEFLHNSADANAATDADVGFSGGVVEFDGPGRMTRSRISDNSSTSISRTGPAGVSGGLAVYDFSSDPRQVTVSDSAITGNRAYAYSATDAATGTGGGVINNSLLDLDGVTVSGNALRTAGPAATSQGGGIWNGALLSGPPVRLRLTRTRITRNTVTATKGGTSQGGGLYTTFPFTRDATTINGNKPNDVFDALPSS